jgi:predicted aspartyl protease
MGRETTEQKPFLCVSTNQETFIYFEVLSWQRALHSATFFVLLLLCVTSARAECTLTKVGTMKLTVDGSRLYVPVSMNDTDGVFLLDTGSERTILNGGFAERAHVGLDRHAGQTMMSGGGGRESLLVNQAHVRHTDIGKVAFNDWEFVVMPAESGGLAKAERDGILGMDFLHYFDMDIDLQAGKLNLWRVAGCTDIHPEWKGNYDAIPMAHTGHQNVTIPIMLDNVFLDVVLDTGAGGLLLSREAASKLGLTDAMLGTEKDAGSAGIGGKFPAVLHRFNMLMVGTGKIKSPMARVETEAHRTGYGDGLMDWRYLGAQKIWHSYGTNTLFVQKKES